MSAVSSANMPLDTQLAVAGLILNALVACATIYLAFVALVHTAKPRIDITLRTVGPARAGHLVEIMLEVANVGHWYATPPAIGIAVFTNVAQEFDLLGIAYGSVQQKLEAAAPLGKYRLPYVRATGIKLVGRGHREIVVVHAKAPVEPGPYLVQVDAYSDNGASLEKSFRILVVAKDR